MNRHIYRRLVSLLAAAFFAAASGGYQTPAEGNEPERITVTTLLDVVDDADGATSLREALGRAEAGGAVTFDAALAGGTIVLAGAPLEITEGIAVDAGSVGGITIDAGGKSRVISVTGGDADRPAALIGLTVTGGNVEDDGDEDIHASGGGGIFNNGTLRIVNTVVFGNTACGFGGGIDNDGDMTVVNSTVAGNAAPGFGGGIANVDGRLTLVNSIVSCNRANTDGDLGAYYFSGRNNILRFLNRTSSRIGTPSTLRSEREAGRSTAARTTPSKPKPIAPETRARTPRRKAPRRSISARTNTKGASKGRRLRPS